MRFLPLSARALTGMALMFAGAHLLSAPSPRTGQEYTGWQTLQPQLTYDISVIVKNLEVIVRDKDGRPITGLRPENFTVLEDGVLKKITHFHEVDGVPSLSILEDMSDTPAEKATAASVSPEIMQNRIVFFFDNAHCHPLNRNLIIKKLESFIIENFKNGTSNQAMVVFLDQRLDIIQGFTSDAASLLQAVRSLGNRTSDALTRSRSWEAVQQEITMMAARSPTTSDNENFGVAASCAHGYIEEETNRLAFSLHSLQALSSRLGGIKGRKLLIYTSDPLPLNPAEEVYRFISRLYPAMSAEAEAMRHNASDLFRQTVAVCNTQDISVYAIHAEDFTASASSADKTNWSVQSSGLRPITPGSAPHNNGLETISRETGGSMVAAKRNTEAGLKTLEDDLSHYYFLGYTSDAPADDSVHVINIKIVDASKDCVLRFRTGYLKSSPSETIKNNVIARLFLPQSENPLEARLEGLPPEKQPFGKVKVSLKILVPIKQLTFKYEGRMYVGTLKIILAILDSERSWSEPEELVQDVHIPSQDIETARANWFPYLVELHIKPGQYMVSLAVTDVFGRMTSYFQLAQDIR